MGMSSLLYSTVIIMYLFQSEVESAAFDYHTYNNIQGEDHSRNYGNSIHRPDASNIHAYGNLNTRTSATNKNGQNNNIPETSENYDHRNNYITEREPRNNSRRNYILVTYFFNNNKNISNSTNNHSPGNYTLNDHGSNHYTPKQPSNNINNNNVPSTYLKCKDFVTQRDHYVGEIWYNNTKCEQYICKLGEQHIPYTQTNRCGVFKEQPNCQVRPNYGKIYPSCCPVLHCNGIYEGPGIINHL